MDGFPARGLYRALSSQLIQKLLRWETPSTFLQLLSLSFDANDRKWPIVLKNSVLKQVMLQLEFRCEVCVPANAGF
jgi:hypothetical protein